MARGFKSKSRQQGGTSIPTASMGDIAFLIIIFFMTTSIFGREKGLRIALPEKGEEVRIRSENIMTISVNPDGQVMAGDELTPMTTDEVREFVIRRLAENPELAIAMRVSRRAPYRVMIEVFDQLKLAKADRISLVPVQDQEGT
ncbi:MAG: biopolymer transporter ExbD [bacterium]